jgi:hypothetical protein
MRAGCDVDVAFVGRGGSLQSFTANSVDLLSKPVQRTRARLPAHTGIRIEGRQPAILHRELLRLLFEGTPKSTAPSKIPNQFLIRAEASWRREENMRIPNVRGSVPGLAPLGFRRGLGKLPQLARSRVRRLSTLVAGSPRVLDRTLGRCRAQRRRRAQRRLSSRED